MNNNIYIFYNKTFQIFVKIYYFKLIYYLFYYYNCNYKVIEKYCSTLPNKYK